jgi:hypothetical protein
MTTATIEQPASHFGKNGAPTNSVFAGRAEQFDPEQKARKDKKAVARPTTTLNWLTSPVSDEDFFARLRVLAAAVVASPGAEVLVLTCVSRQSATAYAGHFSRIANENRKRGVVVARAIGDKVVATYDPKAKRV